MVLLAAVLWATMGLFYKGLMARYDLAPLAIIFGRASVAAGALFIVRLAQRHPRRRLELRDWLLFATFGLVGISAFYSAYVYAITLTGMGIAAVLMYTAPAWVAGLGALLLKETLSARKVGALMLSLVGCALVGRVYALGDVRLSPWGLVAGLAAGLTYGLYILFGKVATDRGHDPLTITAYALGFGALFLLPLQSPQELGRVLSSPGALVWLVVLGLVPTLGGGVAFSAGLRSIPAGNASIVATIEPALAALLGWLVWDERMEIPQIIGTALILAAVIILQTAPAGRRQPTGAAPTNIV